MRHQVEDCRRISRNATAEEHVSKLRNRGVREHALDVGLHEGDGGREDRSCRADNGNDAQCEWRAVKDEVSAGDHVDAGRDHGSRVDERGDRSWAFHRVRQPYVEWKLRALAGCSNQQAEGDRG